MLRFARLTLALPLALGHALSMALVAASAMRGWSLDRGVLLAIAGAALLSLLATHRCGRGPWRMHAPAAHGGLALGSFIVCTAHGTGLMLVPALLPLCVNP